MKKTGQDISFYTEKKLIQKALKFQSNAYCPYSKYKVGAAVLTKSGKIYGGCNVENVSYGLTICAERTAIFNAIANGEKKLKAIALAAKNPKACGACRQVMSEFLDKNAAVLLINTSKKGKIKILKYKLEQLLPLAFVPKDLK